MASNERQYLMRTPEGEQYGPVDQETLIRWAQNGRIATNCEIRSTLLARWEPAHKTAFLRDILVAQIEETEKRAKEGLFKRFARRATVKAVNVTKKSISKAQAAEYKSAPVIARVVAGVIDAMIILLWAVIVYLCCALVYSLGILGPNECFYVGFVIFYMGMFAYFLWTLVYTAQTMGQRFVGIILVRREGGQIFSARAFFYTVFLLIFGILTPILASFVKSKRSLHEILTGTRMVRMKLVSQR